MTNVGGGNDDSLFTGQPTLLANSKEALNFLVKPANRLYATKLIDRTGNGDALINRHIGQRADQCAQLGHGGAIAIHFAVGLLEGQRGGEGELLFELQLGHQKRLHDHHAFCMNVATELGLTLNVNKFAVADMYDAANT